jgi:gliding motility-associated-like protein
MLKFTGCSSSSIPNSTAQTPPPVLYNTAGTYNINLSIDEGLPSQSAICKQVVVLPDFQHQPVQQLSVCAGDSIKVGRFNQAAQFAWNTGETADSVYLKTGGTYWVDMTRFGCSNRDSFMLTANAKPLVNIRLDSAICKGDSMNLATQVTGANTYNWTPSSGLSNPNTVSPDASPTTTTQYILTAGSNQGCVAKDSITVTVKPVPVVYLGNDVSICQGDSIVLNAANAGSSYEWQDMSNGQTFSAKDSGFYFVKVSSNGCYGRDTMHVALNPLPQFTVMSDTAICKGQSVSIQTQAASNYSYAWFPATALSNANSSTPVANPSNTTQYILTATSPANCNAKDTLVITVKDLPVVSLGNDTSVCYGDSVILNANNPGSTFLWQNMSNGQIFTAKDSGFYFVKVTTGGCSSADTMHLAVNALPVVDLMNDTSICKGTPVVIHNQAPGNYTYSWYPVTGLSNPTSSAPVAVISNTIKYVLTVKDNFNCQAKDSVTIVGKDVPLVDLGPDSTICAGSPLVLDAQNPGSSYLWNTGSTSQTISVSTPGVYFVSVSSNGCSAADTMNILQKTKVFTVTPTLAAVCNDEPVTIAGSGGDQYQWYKNGIAIGYFDSSITIDPPSPGIYSVIIKENNCGYTDTLSSVVVIKPSPIIFLSKSNDISCGNPRVQLLARGGVGYKWFPSGSTSNDSIPNPWVSPATDTWYKVTVYGLNGCHAADSIQVKTGVFFSEKFYVPNAFTPNADGKNDCLRVRYAGMVTSLDFSIYNRWGEMVFHTNNLTDCWDGNYKGRKELNDVFVYYLKAVNNCGVVTQKGTITVIR